MRRIRVDVPFRAAIGTIGRVSLNFDHYDSLQVPKASLSIDLGLGHAGRQLLPVLTLRHYGSLWTG